MMRLTSDVRRRTPRERGAALVEFALIMPVLLSILLGTITGGFVLAKKNSMSNAVREGARLGATLPEGSSWNDWATTVRGRVLEISGGDLEASNVCVVLVNVSTGTTLGSVLGADCSPTPGPPATPADSAGSCIVKVWARAPGSINVGFTTMSLTLDARAVGRYERDGECP